MSHHYFLFLYEYINRILLRVNFLNFVKLVFELLFVRSNLGFTDTTDLFTRLRMPTNKIELSYKSYFQFYLCYFVYLLVEIIFQTVLVDIQLAVSFSLYNVMKIHLSISSSKFKISIFVIKAILIYLSFLLIQYKQSVISVNLGSFFQNWFLNCP